MKPTDALYQSLQQAYDFLNETLFNNELPSVIFTVQRKAGILGYFAPDRWSSTDGNFCHEIAINPTHIGQSRVIDVLQTLTHEMVHCWQYCFGQPGRNCYHNKEWANKMIEIGLQPSSTGKPGGRTVGQNMSDYPIENGLFIKACYQLVDEFEFQIPWIDRMVVPSDLTVHIDNTEVAESLENTELSTQGSTGPAMEAISPETFLHATYQELLPEKTFLQVAAPKKTKLKYHCMSCGLNVWGKPDIRLLCLDCEENLVCT